MSINPLNDISRVYLEQVAAVEEGVRPGNVETPLDKAAFKKRIRSLAGKEKSAEARKRGHEGKEWYNSGRTYSPDEAKRSRANMDDEERRTRHRSAVDPDDEDDNNYSADKTKNPKKLRKQKAMGESAVPGKPAERLGAVTAIPKSEQDAARERLLAKTKAKRDKMKVALDPVGQEDDDIDNDGDSDKSDKYLLNRRKEIGKAIQKKSVKEGYSNWRQDLSEVLTNKEEDKQIKEKKVNNKIKINPSLKEAVENIGGQLIEIEEIEGVLDNFSESEIKLLSDSLIENIVEEFFEECVGEGFEVEDLEYILCESLDTSIAILNEAKVTYGHDTKVKNDKLEKVKSTVKKVARGVGAAAGAAVRGAKAIGREVKSGYAAGRSGEGGGGSQTTAAPQKTEKKPGLLSRIGSKLKSGLKKSVATGARKVAKGALGVARRMEKEAPSSAQAKPGVRAAKPYRGSGSGSIEKAGSPKPKEAPKKAEKPSDPWEGSATTPPKAKAKAKPKAATKKAAAPKAKAPAAKPAPKRKRKSKLDDLLASVRNEEVQIEEKTLTKMEMKKREEIVKSMKDKASDFEKRYPGRGKEVMYATATKIAKKMVEQMMPEPPVSTDSAIDKKKEMMDKQKLANMKMLQQKQQMLQKQRLQMQKSGKLPLEAD